MITLPAFIVALGLLIAIHEYGHYRVALACGVKVIRFSIGFGRPILRWRLKGKPTEFVIGLLPLGGYVKMLDEREEPVPAHERHLAFNNRPLAARAAIVAAGPAANLLLAVLLYAFVNWAGQEEPVPVLSTPVAGSLAEQAGLRAGELVVQAAQEGEDFRPVRSFDELRWQLTRSAMEGERLSLLVQAANGRPSTREVTLDFSIGDWTEVDARMFRAIGLVAPFSRAVIGPVQDGGAARQAGLAPGDVVLTVAGRPVVDAAQLREWVRLSEPGQLQVWELDRGGRRLTLEIQPQARQEGAEQVVRIGAVVGELPQSVQVRDEPVQALLGGVQRTWEVSLLTLRMMGRMLVGEASLSNLSGPLTIADYAGKSAQLGVVTYLLFLALISVSLGVLNLLPLPMLDGGHLMYYLWEAVTGRGVSEIWMERLQRVGVAVLVSLMAIALFNDLNRLLG